MLKVYRLLRNNQEMGPYTLDELLQNNLKTFDLIWVEGKSCSWSYPYEIEALQPHVAPPPPQPTKSPAENNIRPTEQPQHMPVAPKHVYVSLPTNHHRQQPASRPAPEPRTPAHRQEAPYSDAAPESKATPDALQTSYARSMNEAEEAYTRWIYEKKAKKKSGARKYVLTLLVTAAVLTGGLFAGQALHKAYIQNGTVASTEVLPDVPTATVQTSSLPLDSTSNAWVLSADSLLSQSAATTPTAITSPKAKESADAKPIEQTASTSILPPAAIAEEPAKQPEVSQPVTAETKPVTKEVEVTEKKEKKGFLGGLFKKKKQENEPETNQAEQPEAEQEGRKARRRSSEAGTAINLAAQIELSSSIQKDSWMLGIVGQNLTLHNNSQELVRSATVEVSYFSEENSLLDQKTLQFSNIAPNGKAKLALPDHRLAHKAKFRLVNATGASTAASQ